MKLKCDDKMNFFWNNVIFHYYIFSILILNSEQCLFSNCHYFVYFISRVWIWYYLNFCYLIWFIIILFYFFYFSFFLFKFRWLQIETDVASLWIWTSWKTKLFHRYCFSLNKHKQTQTYINKHKQQTYRWFKSRRSSMGCPQKSGGNWTTQTKRFTIDAKQRNELEQNFRTIEIKCR